MKNSILFLILAITTTNFNFIQAQDCNSFPDTIYNCGFSVNVETEFPDGFFTYHCPDGPGEITITNGSPFSTFTFSECGTYKLHYFKLECELDSIIFEIDDPSFTNYQLTDENTFDYGNINCAQGGFACSNVVEISGGSPPNPNWFMCQFLSCFYTHYSTVVSPENPFNCVADFIDIIETDGNNSNSFCWSGSQDAFIEIDEETGEITNNFFDFLDSLNQNILDLATCPLPETDCSFVEESCLDSITFDTILYPFPIHIGGHWTMIENGDTIKLDNITPITKDGIDLLFYIEPGSHYYGPGIITCSIFEVVNNDTVPAYYNIEFTLWWKEIFVYDTIEFIDIIYHYSDDPSCQDCGGVSTQSSFNIPPAPSFPCGPISVGFGNPCDCINSDISIFGEPTINCINPCTELIASYTSFNPNTDIISWSDENNNQIGNSDQITICEPGLYTFTLLTEFGCDFNASFAVNEDKEVPLPNIENYEIDCINTCVTINSNLENDSSIELIYTYPDGTISNQGGLICEPGLVQLMITNLINGCSDNYQIPILDNTSNLQLSLIDDGPITCNKICTEITGILQPSEIPAIYNWSGPDIVDQFGDQITVCSPGTYNLEVTYGNCTTSNSILIDEVLNPVFIQSEEKICDGDCIDFFGTLICDEGTFEYLGQCDSTFYLTILKDIPDQIYKTFEICDGESIIVDGVEYSTEIETSYAIENPNSACDDEVYLSIDVFYLDLNLMGKMEIDCNNSETVISVSSTNNVNQFEWYNVSNQLIGTGNNITIDKAGIYYCSNHSPISECNIKIPFEIKENTTPPDIQLADILYLHCNSSVQLNLGINNINEYEINWTGPGINSSNNSVPEPIVDQEGEYILTIKNQYGCTTTGMVKVIKIEEIDFEKYTDPICSDSNEGFIKIDVKKGGNPPFQYKINNTDWQENGLFEGLQAGLYSIEILHSDGCIDDDTIAIEEIKPIEPQLMENSAIDLCDQAFIEIDLEAEYEQNPNWEINWSDGYIGLKRKIEEEGNYTLSINNTCDLREYKFDVLDSRVDFENTIYVPNIFSPNEDGLNDFFTLSSPFEFESYELTIYDRWGSRVFYSESIEKSWDGLVQKRIGQQAVYVYMLVYSVRDCNGKERVLRKFGDITLIK